MKILCVIDSLGSGGAQRQMIELASSLNHEHEISILIYHDIIFYQDVIFKHKIKVIKEVYRNPLVRILKIRERIRRENPDVVLSFLDTSNLIAILSGLPTRKWKLIVADRNAKPQINKSLMLIALKYLYGLADYVVANSKANIGMVRKVNPFLRERKCKVIYNGYNLSYWIPEKTKETLNPKYRLLIAARHKAHKNLNGLISAVSLLEFSDLQKLEIHWYGRQQNTSFEKAKENIRKSNLENIFHFFESTESIKEKMLEADAIGLFSFYEGLSNSLCEGMALGKPVISTDVSDAKYFVTKENGFICEAHDPKSIANAIKEFLNTDRAILKRMGLKSREIAELHLNKEIMVKEYLNLFKN
ncbi:MAG: glycosyltransferase family 4 protein [Lunatimonas sp.]|uniref:glycosyltransferase family 4 protein n=1 Tax=Lunatimonas sp. TaxID=2060141 RepID=UPI00263B37AD|nr:glycosyltransferase family 4 protein [Lunatimonas sp.]MCC5936788.1 glycosyltransferase family 4 protein [Lunatimonas sp.]